MTKSKNNKAKNNNPESVDFTQLLQELSHTDLSKLQSIASNPIIAQQIIEFVTVNDVTNTIGDALNNIGDAKTDILTTLVNQALTAVGLKDGINLCIRALPDINLDIPSIKPDPGVQYENVIVSIFKKVYTAVKDLFDFEVKIISAIIVAINLLDVADDMRIILGFLLSKLYCDTSIVKSVTATTMPGLTGLFPDIAAELKPESGSGTIDPSVADFTNLVEALNNLILAIPAANANVVQMENNACDPNTGRISNLISQADQIVSTLSSRCKQKIASTQQIITQINQLSSSTTSSARMYATLNIGLSADGNYASPNDSSLGDLGINFDIDTLSPILADVLNPSDYAVKQPNNRDCIKVISSVVQPSLKNYSANIQTMQKNIENRYGDLYTTLTWISQWINYYQQLDNYYNALNTQLANSKIKYKV